MSMTINNQEDFHRVQRLVWGKLFGLFIQKGREKRGCGGGRSSSGRNGAI